MRAFVSSKLLPTISLSNPLPQLSEPNLRKWLTAAGALVVVSPTLGWTLQHVASLTCRLVIVCNAQ
jgi:hypothetical protein